MSKIKTNKIYVLVSAISLLLLALIVWVLFYGPSNITISKTFNYEADLISRDNFFDSKVERFAGPFQSDSKFGYQVIGDFDDYLLIRNYFSAKDNEGNLIIDVGRELAIDPETGAHVFKAGDRNRLGYLFAPRMKGLFAEVDDKSSFTYWHANYDNPINMVYRGEEELYGLPTYRYEANFTADQTSELGHLEGVGQSKGVSIDVNLRLWIEPYTGYLVRYEDSAVGWFFDLNDNYRLMPWNKFDNQLTPISIRHHVDEATNLKNKVNVYGYVIPSIWLLIIIILTIYTAIYYFYSSKKNNHQSKVFLPLSVLILMLIITGMLWGFMSLIVNQERKDEFHQLTDNITTTISNRVAVYINALNGAKGFVDSSNSVTANEWQSYIKSLKINENFPGIQGFGYSVFVEPQDLISHEEEMKEQGFNNFKVYPDGSRGIYSSIIYIEPLDERNKKALGFDMYQEQTRRLAMDQARDLNSPTISGKVTLVQEIDDDVQAGILVYVPLYEQGKSINTVSERREHIEGHIYGVFRVGDFIESFINYKDLSIGFEIYDSSTILGANEDRLMYRSDNLSAETKVDLFRESLVEVGGRTWVIKYYSLAGFQETTLSSFGPIGILLSGIIFSILMTVLVIVINNRRAKAFQIAANMTHKLRSNQRRLETFNKITTLPDLNFEERIKKILQLATEELGLTLGIVSEITGDKYLVKYHYSEGDMEIDDGQVFNLAETYCSITLANNDVVNISNIKETKYKDHPCYKKTALSAYIGVPIMVKGSRYGTLNFSSREPVRQKFSQEDEQFVKLVSLWLGRILEDKEVDQAKTEFVSMASHQLRTPLTAIGWNTELLLSDYDEGLDGEQKKLLSEIEVGNKRMIDLVNSLLNISRIELGNFIVNPESVDVANIIESLVSEMQPTINLKKQKVEVLVSDGLKEFVADRSLLRIIFQNLLSNAVKYTQENGQIKIKGSKRAGKVYFEVSDNGYGIPTKQQSELFNKFYRADNVVKKSIEGTGLGLYIIKAIVDVSGGSIKVKSKEGEGTTFTIIYPSTGMQSKSGSRKLS